MLLLLTTNTNHFHGQLHYDLYPTRKKEEKKLRNTKFKLISTINKNKKNAQIEHQQPCVLRYEVNINVRVYIHVYLFFDVLFIYLFIKKIKTEFFFVSPPNSDLFAHTLDKQPQKHDKKM